MKPERIINIMVGFLLVFTSSSLAQQTQDRPISGSKEDVRGIYAFLANASGVRPGNSVHPVKPLSEVIGAREEKEGDQNSPGMSQAPQLQRRYPRYRVETGDSLSLQFAFVPDYNQTVSVQPDGYITLREIGDLHVEGLTAPEIADKVREVYSKILHDPVVTINLTDFDKPYFVVGGQVGHPGKFDLRGDTTVTQAVAMAGGFTDASKHSQVLLFRKVSNNWMEAKTLNVKKMMRAGDLSEDLYLQPGDMIFVPQNRISKLAKYLPIPHPGIIINPAGL